MHGVIPSLPIAAMLLVLVVLAVPGTASRAAGASQPGLRAVALRCEYQTNPLGIDAAQPRLSWVLEATRPNDRGQRQTAYQLLVAGSEAALRANRGDLWDSHKVASADPLQAVYGGPRLNAGQRVYWKVRVWDRDAVPSPYSTPAWWEVGLPAVDDWKAKWIRRDEPAPSTEREFFQDRPAPLLRKEFSLGKKVARARVYVVGLGYYELRLNGKKVGDHLLDPAWTTYSKHVFYTTYDVTAELRQGANALGVLLGGGFWDPLPLKLFRRFNLREALPVGQPCLRLQLEVQFTDGSRQTVISDESWKTSGGPIVQNSVYLGEVYDARREQPGWDQPGFADAAWQSAVAAEPPTGVLRAAMSPPIRKTATVKPTKVSEPKPGVFIVDMGQNFAGTVTLRLNGEAGTKVTLRYGELLHPDGTLNPMTSVTGQIKGVRENAAIGAPETAVQTDVYVCRGGGAEEWTPRFTFHGFRYVELTGFPGTLTTGALEGNRLNSDVASAGEFSCSNPLLNRIQEVVRWTQLSNIFSVQSDCPHREKLGYGGDIVATSEMAMLNFDMARFYAKTVQDFADAARPNGGITETAPFVGIADEGLGGGSGPVGWGTAYPLLMWQLYQYYGDRETLAEHYPAARKWLQLLQSRAQDGILDNGISDHESLAPKPRALTGTAFYYYNAHLLSQIAAILGRAEDAKQYAALAASVRDAFNRRFLKPGTGRYDSATQACQAFALYFGLVPPEERAAALKVLVDDIQARGNHLTTGIFGTKYMLEALTDAGRADVAAALAEQKTFPSWGFMLENGATTLWEHWAFSDNVFSHNHPMFGSVSEWFLNGPGGIAPAPDAAGFHRVRLRPRFVPGLTWAKARHRSVRGPIACEWRREGETVRLDVSLPPGVTAELELPAADLARVTEGGRPLPQAAGVRALPGPGTRLQLEAGTYAFTLR
jgi:alpha-L-rhamnosidase